MREFLALQSFTGTFRLIVIVATGAMLCAGCRPSVTPAKPSKSRASIVVPSDQVSPPPPAADQFVGSSACATCHAKQTHDYQHGHPMARSLVAAAQASPLEDYAHAEFSPLENVIYSAEQTPTGVLHHEKRLDAAGQVIYDQALPVAFTVGSGARGRSYLINHDGRLYASPISWYSDPGQWDLSPGYGPRSHPRFERRATEGCLACHAGRSVVRPNEPNRFAEPVFLEQSIGCERCHGPGKAHIAFRASTSPPTSGPDPIVNPAKLTGARRDAICNQCHLQGMRRVLREGRTEFDFTPGMTLSDNWITFLKTEGVEKGVAAAVSQVEQMYASQCYRQSDGGLSCIGCHDGHAVRAGAQVDLGYREKCLVCHSTGKTIECSEGREQRLAATAVDSCIVCHMPKFPASDVHTAQTDHRILRRQQPAKERPKKSAYFEQKPVIFDEPRVKVPSAVLDRARGIFLAEQAAAGGTEAQAREAIELLLPAIQAGPQDIEGRFAVGKAFQKLKQPELTVTAWEQVVSLQPTHEDALELLAIHYHESRDMPNARRYYERLLEVNPYRSQYYGRLAHVLGQLDEVELGIAAAKKCLELNPSLAQSHQWLVEAYRRTGDTGQMNFHAEKLKQFQSSSP